MVKQYLHFYGDVHGQFEDFTNCVNNTPIPDYIFQCGDFGTIRFDFNEDKEHLKKLKRKVSFIDGNHEGFDLLPTFNEKYSKNYNCEHLPRGTIKKINDTNILFIGGAESIDKKRRVHGFDWFPEEDITYSQIEKILDQKQNINIVVSHTAPIEFEIGGDYVDYSNRRLLSVLRKELRPDLWIFGHFHEFRIDKYNRTKWVTLDCFHPKEKYNGRDMHYEIMI